MTSQYRFETHQCQHCGADIGYLGRGIEAGTRLAGFTLHRCEPPPVTLRELQERPDGLCGPKRLPDVLTRLERGTWWAKLLGKGARWWRETHTVGKSTPTSIEDWER